MEFPKRYASGEAEPRLQKWWQEKGFFRFDRKDRSKPVFSIDTPPPTVSGRMHIGHACSYTHMDIIARYKRMRGYNVFYPFGTDDNGLATERLVEREKNVQASRMDRQEFIKLCLEYLEEALPDFVSDWKRIGMSCDWSLYYSTIDEHCRRISQWSFIELYKMGREYRKRAPVIWCPTCQTAIAQVEMEDKEKESTFNDIVFDLVDGGEIVIATTRPELLPACVAIFFHPDDERYKSLEGKKARVPLFGHEVPIMPDERVDPEKGTGIVMCCTFGDQTDIEWYLQYNLPLRSVLSRDGRLTSIAGKYEGLTVKEARRAILEDLEREGRLKRQVPIRHTVNVHERCGTEIEILETEQWFIRYLDLKDKFIELGRQIKWHPDHMRHRYENWVRGLQWDWCISRQRFFGVPFPVWYCKKCGEIILAREEDLPVDPLKDSPRDPCPKCGSTEFEPERDVLDTWATSSLAPLIAIRLLEKEDPEAEDRLFPMDLRPQAHDIISFWLFNTVVKSYFHKGSIPWRNAMISGWVLDPHGRKMSKSKGNVVDPRDVLARYSADALRFWAAGNNLGEDTPYKEKELATGQKLVTKIWNASRFIASHLDDYEPDMEMEFSPFDRWMLSRLAETIENVTQKYEDYDYSHARRLVYSFFWHEFCDYYLEIVKDRLYNPDAWGQESRRAAQHVLYTVLRDTLKMLAPIVCHVTDEVWGILFREREGVETIHLSPWPEPPEAGGLESYEDAGSLALGIIAGARKYKAMKQVSLKQEIGTLVVDLGGREPGLLREFEREILATTRARSISWEPEEGLEWIEVPEEGIRVAVKE